jgi:hypothetical protein
MLYRLAYKNIVIKKSADLRRISFVKCHWIMRGANPNYFEIFEAKQP